MDKQNETKQASGFKLGFNKKFSHVKEAYLISPIMGQKNSPWQNINAIL